MITARGSIPYPPTANAAPIRALAVNLQQLSTGLVQGSQQLQTTVQAAGAIWQGEAAESYGRHTLERSRTLEQVGTSLGRAAPVLQTFAAAIDTTSATYSAAAVVEQAARGGLPWTAAVLSAALATQTGALAALQAAGAACASALAAIELQIAAAQFAGVDRNAMNGLKEMAGSIWDNVVELVTTGDTDAAMSALDDTTNVVGLVGILGAVAGAGAAASPRAVGAADRRQLVEPDDLVSGTKMGSDAAANGIGGAATGLRHGVNRWSHWVNRANGTRFRRWNPSGRGVRTGLTATEAARTAARTARWTRAIPVVSAAIDGGIQYHEDSTNPNLTRTERVTRVSAAVALEGGGGWAGAAVGAKGGAAAGAAVGAFFGGVGAVPGAVVGGAIGAIGGGIAGSAAGRWVKQQLFSWNPGGVFR